MHCTALLSLFLLLAFGQAHAGIALPPTTLTVGTNAAECDFTSIQEAIDAADPGDIVRVQSTSWLTPAGITIANKALTLTGGYSDCNDTTADPAQPAFVSMPFGGTALTVSSGIAGVQEVWVRNFVLRQGDGGMDKGGGVDLSGAVTLRLDNVDVQESQAQFGGGIRIHGGPPHPTLSLEGGSRIGGTAPFTGHNFANQDGGGIHCEDGGLIEWRDAQINFNSALNGGGMYLQGCTLTTPTITGTTLRTSEIRGNQSLFSGGGVMMLAGASATLSSQFNRQVVIAENASGLAGAGVYMNGSAFTASGVHIEYNSAEDNAGGVHLNASTFILQRGADDGSNCPDKPRCARLSFNSGETQVGGIYASNNSQITLQGVFLEANLGVSSGAMLLTSNSTAVLRDVQIIGQQATNPGGTRVFSVIDSSLDLRNVSTAGNDVDFMFFVSLGGQLQVHDSILWEPGMVMIDGDGSEQLDLDCNNASENTTLPGAVTHDPGFRALPDRGLDFPLLRLTENSQNIDRCPEAPAPGAVDLGGGTRLVDAPLSVKGAGDLDRGAFEFEPPLFKDGFED